MNCGRLLLRRVLSRRRVVVLVAGSLVLGLALVVWATPALAGDVYSNIGPASQLPAGGIVGRYPLFNYQLDQYFPAISVGVFSGIDTSGVAPMIAYFLAQVVWLITLFTANAVITVFTFCFNLNLLGDGNTGSGALAPVAQAIHDIYAHTFGTPWLIAALSLVALWAMWRALVLRRYTETAAALAVSLVCCLVGLGIVIAPQATITPASNYANQMSTALLSLTSTGEVSSETAAKQASADQLFDFLVEEPWTVLEFGGLDHCVSEQDGKTVSVPVQPLSSDPAQEAGLTGQLESGPEIHADGKTCINNQDKYAPHFLAFSSGSKAREEEHEALQKGDDADLPENDPAKGNKSYPLGPADQPAAEAMGKGGQYQRLLLSLVILAGEIGAFLLLGSLAVGVILAAMLLLFQLLLAPVALVVGVIPGRGHEFFRRWLTRLVGYLLRKVIYSLILALVLVVCHALASAASNLGWLLAFLLQATFLWAVFLSRHRLTNDLVAATAGPRADQDGVHRLQSLYYSTRLARMAGLLRSDPTAASPRGRGPESAAPPPPTQEPPADNDTPSDPDNPDAPTPQPASGHEQPAPDTPDSDHEQPAEDERSPAAVDEEPGAREPATATPDEPLETDPDRDARSTTPPPDAELEADHDARDEQDDHSEQSTVTSPDRATDPDREGPEPPGDHDAPPEALAAHDRANGRAEEHAPIPEDDPGQLPPQPDPGLDDDEEPLDSADSEPPSGVEPPASDDAEEGFS